MANVTISTPETSAAVQPSMEKLNAVYKRLKELEREIQQLQEAVRQLAPPLPGTQPTDHPYIEKVPSILSGEPVIKGTRTPVRAIVEYWRLGATVDDILEKLPYLRLAQVCDALGYFDDHRQEVEHYILINRVPVND